LHYSYAETRWGANLGVPLIFSYKKLFKLQVIKIKGVIAYAKKEGYRRHEGED